MLGHIQHWNFSNLKERRYILLKLSKLGDVLEIILINFYINIILKHYYITHMYYFLLCMNFDHLYFLKFLDLHFFASL